MGYLALVILLVSTVLGISLAKAHLRNQDVDGNKSLIHAGMMIVGVLVLFKAAMGFSLNGHGDIAFFVFIGAIVFKIIGLLYQFSGKRSPNGIIITQNVLATIAVIALMTGFSGHDPTMMEFYYQG